MKILHYLFLLAGFLVLSSCKAPATETSLISPDVFQVGISTAIEPEIQAQVFACHSPDSSAALQITSDPASYPSLEEYDLLLWWGDPILYGALQADKVQSFEIKNEQVLLISSDDLNLDRLSSDEIRNIFSGSIQNWSELDGSKLTGQIQVWTMPPSTPLREVFQRYFLEGQKFTTLARISPSPKEMVQLISIEPRSIGFSLSSHVNRSQAAVNIVRYEDERSFPVLAILPDGNRSLLPIIHCLQEELGMEY